MFLDLSVLTGFKIIINDQIIIDAEVFLEWDYRGCEHYTSIICKQRYNKQHEFVLNIAGCVHARTFLVMICIIHKVLSKPWNMNKSL